MKNKIFSLLFFLFVTVAFSQQKVTWKDLSHVKFTKKFFPKYNSDFLYPKFLPQVKKLEGKRITVKGYFLDLMHDDNIYVLSKGPMAACFFCGVGGPETAVELQFDKKQKFKTDDIVSVTGVLTLNADDVEHFNYILTKCTIKLAK